MTLQQLEYIVAVEKYGQFVRAAEACDVTQSTLSAMVQKLEQEFDITIFDRKSHPITPTTMGRKILKYAHNVLFAAESLRDEVVNMKGSFEGVLRLGVNSTVTPFIIPQIFRVTHELYPNIRIFAEEGRSPILENKLCDGDIEVALVPSPVENPDLLVIPIYIEHFVAYVSPEDPFYKLKEISTDTWLTPRIWLPKESYCPEHATCNFSEIQTHEFSHFQAGSIDTLIRIVDLNGGYTIIPELFIPSLSDKQKENLRNFTGLQHKREISLVIHKYFVREGILNVLVDILKHIIPESLLKDRIKKFKIRL